MPISYNPKVVTDNLVLYLDAGNIKSYPGSGTTWFDLTTNKNDGVMTNGPVYSTLGGGSISFDGVDDYIVGSMVNFPSVLDFTSVCWFRTNVSNKEQHFFNLKGGGMQFYVSTSNKLQTSNWGALVGATTIQTNRWYMACLTRLASTGDSVAYLNGAVDATAVLPAYAASTQYIGGNYVGGGNYFLNGYLAVGMFYTRVLSQDEIVQNFNALRGRFGV